jgi:hypothetical protein
MAVGIGIEPAGKEVGRGFQAQRSKGSPKPVGERSVLSFQFLLDRSQFLWRGMLQPEEIMIKLNLRCVSVPHGERGTPVVLDVDLGNEKGSEKPMVIEKDWIPIEEAFRAARVYRAAQQ